MVAFVSDNYYSYYILEIQIHPFLKLPGSFHPSFMGGTVDPPKLVPSSKSQDSTCFSRETKDSWVALVVVWRPTQQKSHGRPLVSDLVGGNFQRSFNVHPENLGKMNPIWRAYFSKGLVQPPTRWVCYEKPLKVLKSYVICSQKMVKRWQII